MSAAREFRVGDRVVLEGVVEYIVRNGEVQPIALLRMPVITGCWFHTTDLTHAPASPAQPVAAEDVRTKALREAAALMRSEAEASEQTAENYRVGQQHSLAATWMDQAADERAYADRILALIDAPAPAAPVVPKGWQPIETAPKDGVGPMGPYLLLGHAEKRWIRFGRYYTQVGKWYYSGTSERSQWSQTPGDAPTHWQPLPEPPAALIAAAGEAG